MKNLEKALSCGQETQINLFVKVFTMFSKLREFDFYRRIPKDLTEASTHGSILSICASIFMVVLFALELSSFLSVKYTSSVGIDTSTEAMLRINFNITMLDLPCEFATIDVVDVLGSRFDNVTKNINKWQIDSEGVRRNYAGRNREQPDLMHDTHHPDIETLHMDGVHATPIHESEFDQFISQNHYTFVNFYAPWCIWCQRLEPVWEAFAEVAERDRLPVRIVKVDCVENRDLCTKQKIQAFPLLRWFKDGVAQAPDYRSDRTVDAFVEFIRSRISADEFVARLGPDEKEAHIKAEEIRRDDHPGCMMSGFLLVNRYYILYVFYYDLLYCY
jgi:protein disulfide-isomerase-like protein